MRKIMLALAVMLSLFCGGGASANDEAIVDTMKMRAWMQRDLENIFLLFGDQIGAPKSCYEAAVSNYIHDLWNELAKSYGCANDETLCNKDPKAMEDFALQLKNAGRDINNPQDRKTAFHSQNVWFLADQAFKRLRKLHYGLDPADEVNSFSAQRQSIADIEQKAQPITQQEKLHYLGQLNQYLGLCHSLKPMAWTMTGNDLPMDDGITDVSVKISQEALLLGYMVALKLPPENRGYLGCLYTWNEAERSRNQCKDKSCADVVPADDKDMLMAKLNELKQHQCNLTNALQMVPVTNMALPVN